MELRELVEQLDKGKIVRTAANKGIEWGFNPSYALYFNTVHETMMKAAKRMKNWWLQSSTLQMGYWGTREFQAIDSLVCHHSPMGRVLVVFPGEESK